VKGDGIRQPYSIYLTPPGAPPYSGQYWGLATILIDDQIILSQAGISQDTDGLQYALRGKDGMGAHGEVFSATRAPSVRIPWFSTSKFLVAHGS
jgi:sensor domain CHASE-containing protein